eukprot:CAMPEP_0172304776 /NCGR_PEP_ID=MMETSP1058-20130122/6157_1 /TAXON_ID=83371 /ORGANISM="Detonula confervacea, Strain CCMP 353" /LENGTH=515 /DNA_ID=CAMNT_0013016149 /DNA_START=274 /DNA_END=1821 /DNA_ORIENTATION=+
MTDAETKIYSSYVDSEQEGQENEKLVINSNQWTQDSDMWERSILNTMKLLDIFGSQIHDDNVKLMTVILNQRGWDEQNNPACSIRGDMDSLVVKMMEHIMTSKWRFDGCAVPMEAKMLPLVSSIRKWTAGMMSKPSFTLTFGLHLLLLSIFEIQGDGDVSRLGNIAKRAYGDFFSQAKEHLTLDIPCCPRRENCLNAILETRRVTQPTEDECDFVSSEGFDLLFWNPLCAGLFLGYTTICLSLEGGLAAINTNYELSAILHLYNALKVRDMVDDDLPLLGDIDRKFSHLKCLWNGWDKPQQGKLTYRFHLSMGSTNEFASWKQDMARYEKGGGEKPTKKPNTTLSSFNHTIKTSKRVSTKIDPAEVSKTYKMHCLSNFEDVEDVHVPKHVQIDPSCHMPMPLQIHEKKSFLLFVEGLNCELGNLLKYNMVAVGTVFNQFLYETFHPNNNESIARFTARADLPVMHPGDVRGLVNIGVVGKVLAGLDYDQEDTYEHLAEAFEDFFNNLDMSRVCLY